MLVLTIPVKTYAISKCRSTKKFITCAIIIRAIPLKNVQGGKTPPPEKKEGGGLREKEKEGVGEWECLKTLFKTTPFLFNFLPKMGKSGYDKMYKRGGRGYDEI